MLKKAALISMFIVLCAAIIGFAAQGGESRQDRGRRSGMGMSDWFQQLEKAHADKDLDRIGELIGRMKQRREQMITAAGRRQGPTGGRTTGSRRFAGRPGRSPEELAAGEKKIKDVLAYMQSSEREGMMNVPPEDGLLLRVLTEAVGARRVVEVGTSSGYSALWFCLALQRTGGQIITHEIDEGRFNLAGEHFEKAGVSDIVTRVLGDAHETVARIEGPIDVLFLDADKSGYMDYLEQLMPRVRPGGLILAHNTTNAGSDMQDFINEIKTNDQLVTVFLHEDGPGLSTSVKKRQ